MYLSHTDIIMDSTHEMQVHYVDIMYHVKVKHKIGKHFKWLP